MSAAGAVLLVARRELLLLHRGKGARTTAGLLLCLAWLPPLLLQLRAGGVGLAGFGDARGLTIALVGTILPLLGLLFGVDALAGELADGSLPGVVTLPISRTGCYLGKLIGRSSALLALHVLAFGSAGMAVWLVRGGEGGGGYLATCLGGALLVVACCGIGVAVAGVGRGRVRAYGAALVVWLVLVFVVDGLLLVAIVSSAPPAPEQVGSHGHDELTSRLPADRGASGRWAWAMALDPVDLFRLGAMRSGSTLGAALDGRRTAPLAVGWAAWLLLPSVVGLARFRRRPLR